MPLYQLQRSESCQSDFVEVYEVRNGMKMILGKFCGTDVQGKKIKSTGSEMTIKFQTDISEESEGFSVRFVQVANPSSKGNPLPTHSNCQQDFLFNNRTIRSPNYPLRYAPITECISEIRAPPGTRIYFTFHSFKLEYGRECEYDSVTILDGDGSNDRTLGKFCGNTIPEPIVAPTNKITVIFVTDDSFEMSGFDATISKAITCRDITCLNGGQCKQNEKDGTFRWCECTGGYKGKFCENATTCSEIICLNGGQCKQNEKDGSFRRCECTGGYKGKFCEIAIRCSEVKCENDGYCKGVGIDRTFKCQCKKGYTGKFCENEKNFGRRRVWKSNQSSSLWSL